MQLTLHTDLALRLMVVLARSDGAPMALPSFSAEHRVSYSHVAKVAQKLVRHGYLQSVRGRAGGMQLAKPPEEIVIGDVVRRMEPTMQLVDCPRCALNRDCGLISPLDRAKQAFLDVLDAVTLADAAKSRTMVAA